MDMCIELNNIIFLCSHTGVNNINDLAHQGTGFPTWHRLLMVWLEREIQVMLGDHHFRLRFWNWLEPQQRLVPFRDHRLGGISNVTVTGDLVNGNWTMVCWNDKTNFTAPYDVCDPRQLSDAVLRRCPDATLCERNNPVWPSYRDYHFALSIEDYDVSPYNAEVACTDESYRAYMEGFLNEEGSDCEGDPMCTTDGHMVNRLKLHNVVHTCVNVHASLKYSE